MNAIHAHRLWKESVCNQCFKARTLSFLRTVTTESHLRFRFPDTLNYFTLTCRLKVHFIKEEVWLLHEKYYTFHVFAPFSMRSMYECDLNIDGIRPIFDMQIQSHIGHSTVSNDFSSRLYLCIILAYRSNIMDYSTHELTLHRNR